MTPLQYLATLCRMQGVYCRLEDGALHIGQGTIILPSQAVYIPPPIPSAMSTISAAAQVLITSKTR